MTTLIAIIALLALVAGLVWWGYRRGQRDERGKAAEDALDDVEEASRIRDRLRTDPDYLKRVRQRFTR